MAVKDKTNGAKHKGRLAKDGPVRAIGQAAAVAGTSGVLLLALKAAVLVAPTVLPHAAGAGLNALGIPNALSAIGDTSGALAGTAPAPITFQSASTSTPVDFGDTQPTTSRRGTALIPTSPSGTGSGNSPSGNTNPIDNDNNIDSGDDDDEDEDETGRGSTPPGGTDTTPPTTGDGTTTTPKKGLVGGVVDTVEKTLPPVSTVTSPLKGVTDTVDGATTVLEPVKELAKPVTGFAKSLPVVDDVVTTVDPSPSSGASSPQLLGTVTGAVGGLTKGTGGLGGVLG